VPGALVTFEAGTRLGHQGGSLFREGRDGKFQVNVTLDPFFEMANG
jgi:hypothetical protein